LDPQQHFTKPPAFFNTASLVKTLEEKGVGRPSTYASIVDTLIKRTYVEKNDKAFVPTDLGKRVCTFLMSSFPELMNIDYTARIEDQLDDVAEGKKVWYTTVDGFFKELEKRLIASRSAPSARVSEETDIVCPTCGKYKLIKKSSRFGNFYGCAGYADKKKCVATFKIGPDGQPIIAPVVVKRYIEGKVCNKCGKKIIIRTGKKSGKEFGGCSAFPKCRGLFDLEGNPIEFKKRSFKKKG
jgi:DNA topoisomerase-1